MTKVIPASRLYTAKVPQLRANLLSNRYDRESKPQLLADAENASQVLKTPLLQRTSPVPHAVGYITLYIRDFSEADRPQSARRL